VKLKGLGGVPLVHRRDGRALVGLDLLVADDADDELVAEGARLAQRVAMAVVHHVEAAVHVHAHRALAAAPEPAPERVHRRQRRDGHGTGEVERQQRGAQHDASDDARRQRPGTPSSAAAPRLHGDTEEWGCVALCGYVGSRYRDARW
jgi:hypothetical protein